MKTLIALAVALFAATAALGQGRPLRLFFSHAGLTDPNDTNSAALPPDADLGVNPVFNVNPGESARLYIWAQITPPGTPNNAIYPMLSLRASITGAGGAATGHAFWNYTNGSYGTTGRWQQFSQSRDATGAHLGGVAVTTGAGVNNTQAAASNDRQHRRFAIDGMTRIDATLLGWVEMTGVTPGQTHEIFFAIGSQGITQAGQPVQQVYLGWGDEFAGPFGNDIRAPSPDPDAFVHVLPEPSTVVLLAVACAMRRRCA